MEAIVPSGSPQEILLAALICTAQRGKNVTVVIAGNPKRMPADAALELLMDEPGGWDWDKKNLQRVHTMWPLCGRTQHAPPRPLTEWEKLDPLYKIGIPVLQPYAPGRVLTTNY